MARCILDLTFFLQPLSSWFNYQKSLGLGILLGENLSEKFVLKICKLNQSRTFIHACIDIKTKQQSLAYLIHSNYFFSVAVVYYNISNICMYQHRCAYKLYMNVRSASNYNICLSVTANWAASRADNLPFSHSFTRIV